MATKRNWLTGGVFLDADKAVVKTAGTLTFADGVRVALGTGNDAQLWCNGSHAYFDLQAGIGNFYIRDGTATRFTFDDAGHFTASGNINGAAISGTSLSVSGNVTGSTISGTTLSASGDVTGSTLSGTTLSASGNVTGVNMTASGNVVATGNVTGASIKTGSWTIDQDGNDLVFLYSGVRKMRLSSTGVVTVAGDFGKGTP